MRDSVLIYRSFWEALKKLPAEDRLSAITAIIDYGLDDIEPDVSGVASAIFLMAKPLVDKNNTRYQNGIKGGRPKTREEPNENQTKTKAEANVNVNDNVNDNVNANDNVNVKDKEDVKDKKNILADARDLFERLWRLYPCKKGKGQVSDTQKKRLLAIGEAELVKAIERYSSELQKDAGWRKPQNGSTFFNSGYVDYLDENFVPSEQKPTQQMQKAKSQNRFNNFPQREYDFDALENQLLNKNKNNWEPVKLRYDGNAKFEPEKCDQTNIESLKKQNEERILQNCGYSLPAKL